MTNINPLKFSVTGQYPRQEKKEDLSKGSAQEARSEEKSEKQLGSNEVLGFLAAQNADLVPVKTQRTYNVSKYVTPEQEARIAESMGVFVNNINETTNVAMNEFGIDEEFAKSIALTVVNSKI